MVPIVRSEAVSFRYPQHDSGLPPTSLNVDAGEVVFISGPSGSGKSTLARCLVGLIPHLCRGRLWGRVLLDGLNTTETPMWKLAERAGLVFQNPAAQMLAVSVEEELIFGLENLGLSRSVIRERLDATLRAFGIGAGSSWLYHIWCAWRTLGRLYVESIAARRFLCLPGRKTVGAIALRRVTHLSLSTSSRASRLHLERAIVLRKPIC